jgi:hypothetical protein
MNKLLFVVAAVCFAGVTQAADMRSGVDLQSTEGWLQCERFAEIMSCESTEPLIVEPSVLTTESSAAASSNTWSAEELECERFAESMSCESAEAAPSGTQHAADAATASGR